MTRRWLFTFLALALLAPVAHADKTERTWQAKCASCHGDDGKAQTAKGKEMEVADMTTAAWQKDNSDEKIAKGIADGIQEGKKKMDAYKSKLSPEQIADLVKYIRGLAAK